MIQTMSSHPIGETPLLGKRKAFESIFKEEIEPASHSHKAGLTATS